MKKQLELEAIKDVLVDLAVEGRLPSDMTQLDMDHVWDVALAKLKPSEEYKKACAAGKLEYYVSENAEEALEKLLKADVHDLADNHVQMWLPLEETFLVDELLDAICWW
jgi:hypothetical protein